MRELSGIGSDEELWARWLSCRWVRLLRGGAVHARGVRRRGRRRLGARPRACRVPRGVRPLARGARTRGPGARHRRAGGGAGGFPLQHEFVPVGGQLRGDPAHGGLRLPFPLLRARDGQARPRRLRRRGGATARTPRPGALPRRQRGQRRCGREGGVRGRARARGRRPRGRRSSRRGSSGAEHSRGRTVARAPVVVRVPTCRHGCQRPDAASPAAPERRRRVLLDLGGGRRPAIPALQRLRVLHPSAGARVSAMPLA